MQDEQQTNTNTNPPIPEMPSTVNWNEMPNTVTYFAQTNFRGEARKFGIKRDDRRRHMYVIGKTGMGKSTMLENMIIQDIENGEGLAVIDPHGDLIEKVIDFVPEHRIKDVIYFNPADFHFPIAFNIVEQVDDEYKNLIANGLVGVFKKIWADSWGPRLEYILINCILSLLDYPGATLLDVNRILVDPAYRKKVIKKIKDPIVRQFWVNEYNNYSEKFRSEAIAPIQNKVGQFLSSSLIRNIVGQERSTIDVRKEMDAGKIILMNLSKGRIGEENAALLGAMMITRIQLAAMSRVDIPESQRRDFFLYVDEFQNFSTESFASILSEARKYRLNITMAHQYIEQLSDEVKAAVFGNVGTMVSFRVGSVDAEELEKEFQPTFMQEDIVKLPSFHVYMRLMIDGVASDPFSATTLAPISNPSHLKDVIIENSRNTYASDRKEVEYAINLWAAVDDEQTQKIKADKEKADARASEPEVEEVTQELDEDGIVQKPKNGIPLPAAAAAPATTDWGFGGSVQGVSPIRPLEEAPAPVADAEPVMRWTVEESNEDASVVETAPVNVLNDVAPASVDADDVFTGVDFLSALQGAEEVLDMPTPPPVVAPQSLPVAQKQEAMPTAFDDILRDAFSDVPVERESLAAEKTPAAPVSSQPRAATPKPRTVTEAPQKSDAAPREPRFVPNHAEDKADTRRPDQRPQPGQRAGSASGSSSRSAQGTATAPTQATSAGPAGQVVSSEEKRKRKRKRKRKPDDTRTPDQRPPQSQGGGSGSGAGGSRSTMPSEPRQSNNTNTPAAQKPAVHQPFKDAFASLKKELPEANSVASPATAAPARAQTPRADDDGPIGLDPVVVKAAPVQRVVQTSPAQLRPIQPVERPVSRPQQPMQPQPVTRQQQAPQTMQPGQPVTFE